MGRTPDLGDRFLCPGPQAQVDFGSCTPATSSRSASTVRSATERQVCRAASRFGLEEVLINPPKPNGSPMEESRRNERVANIGRPRSDWMNEAICWRDSAVQTGT